MTDFTIHSKTTAPAQSQPLLGAVEGKFGFVPNLLAGMSESPALLKAYLDVSAAIASGTLTPLEQQIVQIATSRLNNCAYCVAGHSTVADMQKLPKDAIDAVREGRTIADAKLQALHTFTATIVDSRGQPQPSDTEAFLKAGYTKAQALEVVLSVGLKTLGNYAEHVIGVPLDAAFQGRKIDLKNKRAAA
jgi:uncharacterized peroxidase-related enzyme